MNAKKRLFPTFIFCFCYNLFMKLKPRLSRIILPYLVIYALLLIAGYLLVGLSFPPGLYHYIMIVILTVCFAILIIVGVKYNTYELHKNHLAHQKGFETVIYNFDDILYIDEAYSRKHKTLLFYTAKGHEIFLALDKEMILLERVLEKTKKRITREEYKMRFPRVKL